MNVGAAGFKTDLAKKAYEGTFEIERELRSTQKKLSPCAAECEFLRGRLRKAYEDVVFLDFNFAHEQDVENSLWMKVHHKTIEAYRSRISKFTAVNGKTKPVELRKLLQNFTNFTKDASKYYRGFIQRLITHFGITELNYVLQTFHMEMPVPESPARTCSKELKELVVRSCHVSLIYLGDLSRYRELQASSKNGQKNWGPALGYYQFARKLIPTAGAPMNQLAVVAIYAENTLSSTYFFIRAVCAMEEFPTARDNLALGFKKIVARERSAKQSDVVDSYVRLLAGIYSREQYPDFDKDKKEVTTLLRKSILEREISTDVLAQLATSNIGVAHLLSKTSRSTAAGVPLKSQEHRRVQMMHALLIDFTTLLLDILRHELSRITSVLEQGEEEEDLALGVSAVVRRMLPALRIASKWLTINMLSARPVWTGYLSAMTLCASKFPRNRLPPVPSPLPEDVDMRGFVPLEGGLSRVPNPGQHIDTHIENEVLHRLSALLADAAEIAQRINEELGKNSTELGESGRASHTAEMRVNRTNHVHDPSSSSLGRSHMTMNAQSSAKAGQQATDHEGSVSHASEPSMAFSLNQMVDSLVGHPGEEEELVFKGRIRNSPADPLVMTPASANSRIAGNDWIQDTPKPMQRSLWTSSVAAPTPNQGR